MGVKVAVILGTQLFAQHPAYDDPDVEEFLFVESASLFERLPYHQHKIVLLLSGMRHAAERLRSEGRKVRYLRLSDEVGFAEGLSRLLEQSGADGLAWMSGTDRGVDRRLHRLCERLGLRSRVYPDGLFLTPEELSDGWFAEHPAPLMEDFYRWQRRRTGILMEGDRPRGRRWNFDADNREPLPKRGVVVPELPVAERDAITEEVITEVRERFASHPGDAQGFWLPVTPEDARRWGAHFAAERLHDFGRYEDAMAAEQPFLFHSVASPLLNVGLVTVDEMVQEALARTDEVPLASLEGYLRQLIGWREYMRGMYRAHPVLERVNALGLERPLEDWWYTGADVPADLPRPIRVVLERVHRYGYAHHIERLMVLGNWFLQQGYAPREVNRWFLSLFVDAYEWVMVPNVMGMSQFADGGLVGTKPYVSGGAYLQRMGSWWSSAAEARASAYTSGYWGFLDRHEHLLEGIPRMRQPLAQLRRRREEDAARPGLGDGVNAPVEPGSLPLDENHPPRKESP